MNCFSVSSAMQGISIDLDELRNKLQGKNKYYILRANESIPHIFSELYNVPDVVKKDYFKVKVLELLLFLKTVDIIKESEERPYYLKTQVDVIKEMMQFMTTNIEKHYTLLELSVWFHIPLKTASREFMVFIHTCEFFV